MVYVEFWNKFSVLVSQIVPLMCIFLMFMVGLSHIGKAEARYRENPDMRRLVTGVAVMAIAAVLTIAFMAAVQV